MTEEREAGARIKINKLLEASGWRFEDGPEGTANIELEAGVKFSELGDDLENAVSRTGARGAIDFLLLDLEDATPREEIVDEFPEDAQRGLTRENARKSLPTFTEYQIPIGSKLFFTKDNNITAIVNGERSLEFQGQTLSMSAAALLALKSMGYNWKSANGSAYWEIDGETVWDRWERIHGQNP